MENLDLVYSQFGLMARPCWFVSLMDCWYMPHWSGRRRSGRAVIDQRLVSPMFAPRTAPARNAARWRTDVIGDKWTVM